MSRAAEMIDAGVKPESARAQAVVEKWLEKLAAALRRKPGKAFETWFCKEFPSYFDPRIERYWQLIRQLKGDSKPWPAARAWDWCVKALRVRCVSR